MQASLRTELIALAKATVKESFSKRDVHVVRAVAMLEFLTEQHNGLVEQCRDWYSVHFPELPFILDDHELYLKVVSRITNRSQFSVSSLSSLNVSSQLAQEIMNASKNTMGVEVGEEELAAYRQLATNALSIYAEMKTLETLLEFELRELCPNTLALIGPITAAQLIGKAGSLKQLAIRPAGTIQLLGAEKALFRHLRSNRVNRPPKHGLLLNAGLVKSAARNRKGAVARALAAKISLCARKDYFDPVLDSAFVEKCLHHVQEVSKTVPEKKPEAKSRYPSTSSFSRNPSFPRNGSPRSGPPSRNNAAPFKGKKKFFRKGGRR